MIFNSVDFAVFFPIVVAGYFLFPQRFRWLWLLIASCYFYMKFIPMYILILFFTIVVDYIAGIAIERAPAGRKKAVLTVSLVANIGVLALFKYFNFLNGSFESVFHFLGLGYRVSNLSIILPIGLSFHTFQSMAYTIEIYRGHQKAERHLGIFALYVMFFPQLVAGPIERPQNLLPQFRERHVFDYEKAVSGLRLMAWGLFMKSVVADNLAPVVDAVYNHPGNFVGLPLMTATVCFAFQIYCDFAGYSYLAIGSARIMGFTLMDNFRQPYFSTSISEFWRRWHISLSTWFKDYLYIPLGGNRANGARRCLNLMIVFLISGLWHGANWTFIVWGALHGVMVIAAFAIGPAWNIFRDWTKKLRLGFGLDAFQWVLTFALVNFAWIFFRADTLSNAWHIATHLFERGDGTLSAYGLRNVLPALIGLVGIGIVELSQQRPKWKFFTSSATYPAYVRWVAYYLFVYVVLFFGKFNEQQFIYFQF